MGCNGDASFFTMVKIARRLEITETNRVAKKMPLRGRNERILEVK